MVKRVIIKNNAYAYEMLEDIANFIRSEDTGVCETCLRVLDAIEQAMFNLTVPIIPINGKYYILNDDIEAKGKEADKLIVLDGEHEERRIADVDDSEDEAEEV